MLIAFPSLADTTRLRCLMLMVAEEEVCVCEMTHALGEIQPRSRGIWRRCERPVSSSTAAKRSGFTYRLHPDLPCLDARGSIDLPAGAGRANPFSTDRAALADMPNRPQRRCAA